MDCEHGCCKASAAVGLLVWSTTSKESMKCKSSGSTLGPGKDSSSLRRGPTVMNAVSFLVSGWWNVVQASSLATKNSSWYCMLSIGSPKGSMSRCKFARFSMVLNHLVRRSEDSIGCEPVFKLFCQLCLLTCRQKGCNVQ